MKTNQLIFHQLFEKESSTYTYLLADADTKEAVIIDPVIETVDRDVKFIEELGLKLKYVLDTHVHADHISASGEIRNRTGAEIGVSAAYDMTCPDLRLEEGQEIKFGALTIKVLHTPGHTHGCLTYTLENMAFTGDALLIGGCGRTDFQNGSSEDLFSSVREKLFKLPDETIVFPAHDYKGFTKSSIGFEKCFNSRLNLSISKDDFIAIMANLHLTYPKKIDEAVPANVACGLPIPTISPEVLREKLSEVQIIDVRNEDEFSGELGHIQGAELITLGKTLDEKLNFLDRYKQIVFVCRSGKRSALATKLAIEKGFKNVFNLQGGMINWNLQAK